MKTLAAEPVSSSFKKTKTTNTLLSIKAIMVLACLILMTLLIFSSRGLLNQIIASAIAGFTVLNVIFSQREDMTKRNIGLLIVTFIVAVVGTFLSALSLTRPLTRTDEFFRAAEVDFHRDQLAYSESGEAMFSIGLTSEEFEKLVNFYRQEALDRQQQDKDSQYGFQYSWAYFELEPSSIDRDTFFDSSDEQGGKPFVSHLQKAETTDERLLEDSYSLKHDIESLMEGFPELDDELGRCRVIIWNSPEVTREFYWFEKQQKGYINP